MWKKKLLELIYTFRFQASLEKSGVLATVGPPSHVANGWSWIWTSRWVDMNFHFTTVLSIPCSTFPIQTSLYSFTRPAWPLWAFVFAVPAVVSLFCWWANWESGETAYSSRYQIWIHQQGQGCLSLDTIYQAPGCPRHCPEHHRGLNTGPLPLPLSSHYPPPHCCSKRMDRPKKGTVFFFFFFSLVHW